MTLVCTPQMAKRIMFPERGSAASIQLGHGTSTLTLKLKKINLGTYTFFIDLDHVKVI
jgi:hypothetical protein